MIEEIKKDLLKNISKERYQHVLRVVKTCDELAEVYKADRDRVRLAAFLHDSAKFISKERVFELSKELGVLNQEMYLYNKALIHAPLAAILARDKYGVEDQDVLNAIKYHTTGREDMSLIEKIIFIGDYIEPSREFDGIEEIRHLAFIDIDKSILLALDANLKFLIDRDKLISLDSIEARNYLIIEKIKKEELNDECRRETRNNKKSL